MITRKNKQKNVSDDETKAINIENMTDDEFKGYIRDVENGKEVINEEKAPFRTFETEEEYQSELDKNLGVYLRQTQAELESFNKIKQMAMVLFNIRNADEAMYRLIKTAQSAVTAGNINQQAVNPSDRRTVKRINENGMNLNGAAGDARRSPSDMSDSEFRKYIDKLTKRGNL